VVPPDVESWRVDAPTRPCAFCRQNVEGIRCTSCPRCEAVYHPDCWVSNSRRCAVYGCEPGQKPAAILARPVRPILQPPELPRSGVNWTWVVPILAILASNLVRLGMEGSSSRPPAPPVAVPVRHSTSSAPENRLYGSELLLPVLPQDVPSLMEEARALENSVSGLMTIPAGRLTDDVRKMLRDTVTTDLATLQRALKIYRRCAAVQEDSTLRSRIEVAQWAISRKRSLLFELTP
jgi:hypothetical protein